MDDFDHAVYYSARCSRLRKTFEWEMDRLWLSEETEIRRRRKLEDAEKQASQSKNAKGSTDDSGMNAEGASTRSQNQHVVRSLNWHAFQQLGRESHDATFCAVEVLVGDPVVFDDWAFAGDWFRSHQPGHRADKKSKQAPSLSSQAQLPERTRLHSKLVLGVLDKILKSAGDDVTKWQDRKSLSYSLALSRRSATVSKVSTVGCLRWREELEGSRQS